MQTQINDMLEHVFKKMEEPWMNEDDKRSLREETLAGTSIEDMDAQIEKGVENGYSVETKVN